MILDTYPVVRERNMYKITEQLLALRDIPPGSKLLLVLLDSLSNGGGGVSGYTQLQLAEMLGVSRQSVNWDIQLLSAAGHLRVEGGRPACYFVLCQDACHSVSRSLTLAPFKKIVEQYNEVAKASGLIQCREVSEKRKVAMRRLWKKFKTIDAVRAYIEKVASNPHNVGKNNRKWRADLEYAGREEVIAKVLEHEGDYADPTTDTFYERERLARLLDEGRQRIRRFCEECLVDNVSPKERSKSFGANLKVWAAKENCEHIIPELNTFAKTYWKSIKETPQC